MARRIAIFDTTLRDGEQSPGAHMNAEEKVAIAQQLVRLNVDVIEAGFPASSPGDFESVVRVASAVGDAAVVCALSRAVDHDIDEAGRALEHAARPRIHTGIGVSPQHLHDKLKISEDEAIERAVRAVKRARNLVDDVEFYAEDAGRSDQEFLERILEAVIAVGARVVNIPDTTGYCLPEEFGNRIASVMEHVSDIENCDIAVHTHNDLGLASAVALAAVKNGATQVECTINGLGERAGNASLEEVVMAIKQHGEYLDAYTDINTHEITRTSRLVSNLSGIPVQPNKAIVGANAFAHSSGIHQDGVLKSSGTYQIIDPEEVGAGTTQIVLSSRSGRAALRHRFAELGYEFEDVEFGRVYQEFLDVADKKKEVYDEDLVSLVQQVQREVSAIYSLDAVQISCGFPLTPTATVTLTNNETGDVRTACEYGTGPIDAVYKAIDKIVGVENDLTEFSVKAITRGIDALGEVSVRLASADGGAHSGRGSDGDIIVSAAKAYVNALNRLISFQRSEQVA